MLFRADGSSDDADITAADKSSAPVRSFAFGFGSAIAVRHSASGSKNKRLAFEWRRKIRAAVVAGCFAMALRGSLG